jgi:hypothetical protein
MKQQMSITEVAGRAVNPTIAVEQFSPPVTLTSLPIPAGQVHVVRDDLLTGGTKQRAAVPYLQDLSLEGHREIVYASPFAGFAQVALASSARHLGLACTLFCERDQGVPLQSGETGPPHAFTQLAKSLGAKIILAPNLGKAELLAEAHAREQPGAFRVPLGCNAPSFRKYLKAEISKQWQLVLDGVGATPRTLWLPVGSGTLANAFRDIVPLETAVRGVDVRVLDPEDSRLQLLSGRPGVRMQPATEPFDRPAIAPPPLPSNAHYDAKLWAFVVAEGQDGDVWWNVAR